MNLLHPSPKLSRRDFLKLSGLGLLGLALPSISRPRQVPEGQQGRVIDPAVTLYDIPSFSGNKIKQHWKDSVLSITEVTVGDNEPAHNRIWYRLGEEGYVHSGVIQPVRTDLQEPVAAIPLGGQLAEVTVPYTDAHWELDTRNDVAYRFYYETTYWVIGLVYDSQNRPWYRILDDKWEFIYYAPATHIRLIPSEEVAPLSPDVPPLGKRIEVLNVEQMVIAYEWDQPVFAARTATGARFSNGNYSTPEGRHNTFHKRPSRHMAAGNLAYNGFDLPGVPWVSYITERGIAFHGTYWHNDFGKPRSHGCINLTPKAAKWIYRWTTPIVPHALQRVYEETGTRVDVISPDQLN